MEVEGRDSAVTYLPCCGANKARPRPSQRLPGALAALCRACRRAAADQVLQRFTHPAARTGLLKAVGDCAWCSRVMGETQPRV